MERWEVENYSCTVLMYSTSAAGDHSGRRYKQVGYLLPYRRYYIITYSSSRRLLEERFTIKLLVQLITNLNFEIENFKKQ